MSGRALWESGVRSLISILPPDAPFEGAGKVPGHWNGQNWVRTSGWTEFVATAADVEQWEVDGANVGVLARDFPSFDVDLEPQGAELAPLIVDIILERHGRGLDRSSREPRRMMAYRAKSPGEITKQTIHFEYGGTTHKVELLGRGQQWVADGTHPTGAAYRTDIPEVVPTLSLEDASKTLDIIEDLLRVMGATDVRRKRGGGQADREKVDQERLKAPGGLPMVEALVKQIPNDFRERDDWRNVVTAIKGSLLEEEWPLGLEVALEWSLNWNERPGDRETMEYTTETWDSLHPPFSLGFDYLLRVAREAGVNTAPFDLSVVTEPSIRISPQGLRPEPPEESGDGAEVEDSGVDGEVIGAYAYSDQQLARDLLSRSKDFAHAAGVGWFVWNGVLWVPDHEDKRISVIAQDDLYEKSREVLNLRGLTAAKAERLAARMASKAQVTSVLGIMEKRLAFDPEDFDADPDILNTPAGVVDLRTGDIKPHDQALWCSKVTAVAPVSELPFRWLKFLDEVTRGDPDLILYLQKMMGYSITGHTKLQAVQFITGPGGNGKSVFVETISGVLGDYSTVAPQGMFMKARGERHPADIASLMGARFVTSSETQASGSWDEARVKALTGGERMSARFMRQDFFTFTPRFKLLMTSNHQPAIDNLDPAWRRRMHLIPFEFVPREPDLDLVETLRAEGPAILQWLIDGAVRWYQEGVEKPRVVLEATEEYFDNQNPVGRWLSDCVEMDPKGFVSSVDLLGSFEDWGIKNRESYSLSKKALTQQIKRELGDRVERSRSNDKDTRARGLKGLRLKNPPGVAPDHILKSA